ncbi:MAG: ABC transporter permease [Flavobacteriales bacterium]|nr:ABC transporter permease [Flavobacteriales bacterium]
MDKRHLQLVYENVHVAIASIRGQWLRTILTMLIIAIGITALVGILTSIDGIRSSINSNFTSMGANTFTIRNKGSNVRIGHAGRRPKTFARIGYREAVQFKETFHYPGQVSVSAMASFSAKLKHGSKATQPNINVMGCDDAYFAVSGYGIAHGRNFSEHELRFGIPVIIIGAEVRDALFDKKQDPIGKLVMVGAYRYTVIGVLAEKGSSMSFGGDKTCMIPLTNARQNYLGGSTSFTVSVLAPGADRLDESISEAVGVFRVSRGLTAKEENNFEVIRSDNLSRILGDNLYQVQVAGLLIGIVTLMGAAIGLMNIMLVSVTERTREIGVRKALGATKGFIRLQFLVEAVVISVMGGAVGILLGIGIGNAVSGFIGGGFIIPWLWITVGVVLCFVTGVVSGIYPAIKASNLDPIESLRFE